MHAVFAIVERLRHRGGSAPSSLRLRAYLTMCAVVALVGMSCSSQPMIAPFVDITLSGLPANATQVEIDTAFGGVLKNQTFSGNDMLSHITISLPPDSTGALDLQVTARDGAGCVVAVGMVSQEISANDLYVVTVTLTQQSPPICPMGPPIPITVGKEGEGKGSITASPTSLSCDATCSMQTANLQGGTVITLTATAAPGAATYSYSFLGWDGGNCTGTGTCRITLAQTTTVKANFGCSGWCPDTLPTETNNLYGVFGFSSTNVVAVGAAGTVLHWDGASWKRVTTPTTKDLHAFGAVPTSLTGFAVGDGGTILVTLDGGNQWNTSTNSATVNLRGVWAFTTAEAYAVGDGGGNPWLKYTGTWAADSFAGSPSGTWNAVWGTASGKFIVVGDSGNNYHRSVNFAPAGGGSANLNGVFGTTDSNTIAVGASSKLISYNGLYWTGMTPPTGTGSVTLRGIHGSAANQIFAVGDNGTAWFYNGSSWSADTTGSSAQLNSVWVVSDKEAWAVGQGGVILHKKP